MALQGAFEELGSVMSQMGVAVMEAIGLIGPHSGIDITGVPRVGRLLSYRNNPHSASENPLWCGAHFDHGLFTALAPAFYFLEGQAVPEPMDAGLFVKTTYDGVFKKVVADDPDVLLFQVGEFGQLATSDAIRATEHRVRKAEGAIERYAMALFYDASPDTVIRSISELTSDARYGGGPGDPCSYARWHEESFKRYLVTEEQ